MAVMTRTLLPSFFILLIASGLLPPVESSRVITIANNCKEMVWPGITPGENFNGGGLALKPGQSAVFTAPAGWSGRIWGRTGCNFDKSDNGTCQTGSCDSFLECGVSGSTPVTLADVDFYDVSLVDGFNLPIVVRPVNGKGNCTTAGCDSDLRLQCPNELALKVGVKTVACRSACDVFNTDEYCCRGVYGNPVTCVATTYSKKFKQACAAAYSYAYDDPTSIFTCSASDYIITFCASRKQTVCTYHNNRVVCSGSKSSNSLSPIWMVAMFSYLLMLTLWIVF